METEESQNLMYYQSQSDKQFIQQDGGENGAKSIKYYDGVVVASQFINYFYQLWTLNPTALFEEDIIKSYSKLKYNNIVYEGSSFIEVLVSLVSSELQFVDCNFEILDSGSRQIYILVNGIIKNNQGLRRFSQTFMIAYAGENNKKSLRKWTLMNSILMIKPSVY